MIIAIAATATVLSCFLRWYGNRVDRALGRGWELFRGGRANCMARGYPALGRDELGRDNSDHLTKVAEQMLHGGDSSRIPVASEEFQ